MLLTRAQGAEPAPAPSKGSRPRWWTQALLIVFGLWAYDAINNLSGLRRASAMANATGLVHLEQRLHLNPEITLNHWLAVHGTLGRFVGDYYDLAHFAVTLTLLAWVLWRHVDRYRVLRNTLIGINVIGFAVYWAYPVAPPRMLASFGFIDIVAVSHSVGAWSSGTLASQANEFAAMPSLHMAWAVWCGLAVWLNRKDPISRALAIAYPVLTGIVVIATANHYFLDVAAGVGAAAVSALAALGLERRRARGTELRPQPVEVLAAPPDRDRLTKIS